MIETLEEQKKKMLKEIQLLEKIKVLFDNSDLLEKNIKLNQKIIFSDKKPRKHFRDRFKGYNYSYRIGKSYRYIEFGFFKIEYKIEDSLERFLEIKYQKKVVLKLFEDVENTNIPIEVGTIKSIPILQFDSTWFVDFTKCYFAIENQLEEKMNKFKTKISQITNSVKFG